MKQIDRQNIPWILNYNIQEEPMKRRREFCKMQILPEMLVKSTLIFDVASIKAVSTVKSIRLGLSRMRRCDGLCN